MRPVFHGDVVSAARADFCATLIRRADTADKHCRQTGQVHLMCGNGSLMAVARTYSLPPEPGFDDDTYCSCVEIMLHMLVKWRVNQKRN